jgi:4'-phosphopantetheinyl transferase
VDVEEKRPNLDHDALARRFFSDAESQELSALEPEDAIEGFYTIWTRKEAVMKAVGRGLSMGIDSFSVSIGSAHQRVTLETDGAWTVVDLGRSPSYAGALAMSVDGPVRCFRWRG